MARVPSGIETIEFDCIVIGAGVNGAGIARDAAMRGLRVLLLEKGDICSGTSAWSTRLIHGGLRYLEYGEIGLVRESLRERETLLKIAPHLVRPLRIQIPIYSRARRGTFTINAGMLAYDLLSMGKSLERYHSLSREQTLSHVPGLNPDGLKGAVVYYDAQVEYAERLVLENVLSAKEHGSTVITYARVDRFIIEGGVLNGLEFVDEMGGGGRYVARAPVTVNASGPWVDSLLKGIGSSNERLIGGTKGSHIVVEAFQGAPSAALYLEAGQDGRPFFVIPWNGEYLIGTTDSRYDGDPDGVEATADEIEYLLRETNRAIPSAALTHDSILFTYSGIRPLAYHAAKAEKSITRKHFLRDHSPALPGLISIVGGKLTTYRSLSEQTVDAVFKKLARSSPDCETAHVPLPGAGYEKPIDGIKSFDKLHESSAKRLLRIYGTRAREVLDIARTHEDLTRTLTPATEAIGAEVLFAFRTEMAETLSDCLMRRTMIGLSPSMGVGEDVAASEIARKHLGWTAKRAAQEVRDYRGQLARFHPRVLRKILVPKASSNAL
jgi:glycerol-3-phosphate dehydrogenase